MMLSQAIIGHTIAVAATVVLLALLVGIELNPGIGQGRRLLLAFDMAVLGLVILLGAL
jgi:hypothetical protein